MKAVGSDIDKVINAYALCPVPHHDIVGVELLYNSSLEDAFRTRLTLMEHQHKSPAFLPGWQKEPNAEWRDRVMNILELLSNTHKDPDFPNLKLIPAWHGTRKDMVDYILEGGYEALAITDQGFLGKARYFTPDAEYAFRVYAQAKGALILNWISCSSAYPVVGGDMPLSPGADQIQLNGDMCHLFGKGPYQNYDAHFAPVIPHPDDISRSWCYPSRPKQVPTYTELAVFQSAQALPRYLVHLKPRSIPVSIGSPQVYGFWLGLHPESHKNLAVTVRLLREQAAVQEMIAVASQERRRRLEAAKKIAVREEAGQYLISNDILRKKEEIGEGSFSIVYKCERLDEGGSVVAYKELKKPLQSDPKDPSAFIREFRLMLKLRHANIVTLFGITESPFGFVMEMMERGHLRDILVGNPIINWDIKWKWSMDAARGLKYLHDNKTLHRDLKAENVFIGKDGNAKIGDFGLATLVSPCSRKYSTMSSVGSVPWMAPEIIMTPPDSMIVYSQHSDIYAFGMLLYEILMHCRPWEKDFALAESTIVQLVQFLQYALSKEKRPRRSTYPAGAAAVNSKLEPPIEFFLLIEKCWKQDPKERINMVEVMKLLKPHVQEGTISDTTSFIHSANLSSVSIASEPIEVYPAVDNSCGTSDLAHWKKYSELKRIVSNQKTCDTDECGKNAVVTCVKCGLLCQECLVDHSTAKISKTHPTEAIGPSTKQQDGTAADTMKFLYGRSCKKCNRHCQLFSVSSTSMMQVIDCRYDTYDARSIAAAYEQRMTAGLDSDTGYIHSIQGLLVELLRSRLGFSSVVNSSGAFFNHLSIFDINAAFLNCCASCCDIRAVIQEMASASIPIPAAFVETPPTAESEGRMVDFFSILELDTHPILLNVGHTACAEYSHVELVQKLFDCSCFGKIIAMNHKTNTQTNGLYGDESVEVLLSTEENRRGMHAIHVNSKRGLSHRLAAKLFGVANLILLHFTEDIFLSGEINASLTDIFQQLRCTAFSPLLHTLCILVHGKCEASNCDSIRQSIVRMISDLGFGIRVVARVFPLQLDDRAMKSLDNDTNFAEIVLEWRRGKGKSRCMTLPSDVEFGIRDEELVQSFCSEIESLIVCSKSSIEEMKKKIFPLCDLRRKQLEETSGKEAKKMRLIEERNNGLKTDNWNNLASIETELEVSNQKYSHLRASFDSAHPYMVRFADIMKKCDPQYISVITTRLRMVMEPLQAELRSKIVELQTKQEAGKKDSSNKFSEKDDAELLGLLKQLDDMDISVEVFHREMLERLGGCSVQDPNTKLYKHRDFSDVQLFKDATKRYIEGCVARGIGVEFLNGDTLTMDVRNLREIYATHIRKHFAVVFIVGQQSSGKSLLWNSICSLSFGVSSVRCTIGCNIGFSTVRKSDSDDMMDLICVDTEGLLSPCRSNTPYDKYVMMFAYSMANVVVINVKGQLLSDMIQLMRLVAYAAEYFSLETYRPRFVIALRFIEPHQKDAQLMELRNELGKISVGRDGKTLLDFVDCNADSVFTLPSAFYERTLMPWRTEESKKKINLHYIEWNPIFFDHAVKMRKMLLSHAQSHSVDAAKLEYPKTITEWLRTSESRWKHVKLYRSLIDFASIEELERSNSISKSLSNCINKHVMPARKILASLYQPIENCARSPNQKIRRIEETAEIKQWLELDGRTFQSIFGDLNQKWINYNATEDNIKNYTDELVSAVIPTNLGEQYLKEQLIKLNNNGMNISQAEEATTVQRLARVIEDAADASAAQFKRMRNTVSTHHNIEERMKRAMKKAIHDVGKRGLDSAAAVAALTNEIEQLRRDYINELNKIAHPLSIKQSIEKNKVGTTVPIDHITNLLDKCNDQCQQALRFITEQAISLATAAKLIAEYHKPAKCQIPQDKKIIEIFKPLFASTTDFSLAHLTNDPTIAFLEKMTQWIQAKRNQLFDDQFAGIATAEFMDQGVLEIVDFLRSFWKNQDFDDGNKDRGLWKRLYNKVVFSKEKQKGIVHLSALAVGCTLAFIQLHDHATIFRKFRIDQDTRMLDKACNEAINNATTVISMMSTNAKTSGEVVKKFRNALFEQIKEDSMQNLRSEFNDSANLDPEHLRAPMISSFFDNIFYQKRHDVALKFAKHPLETIKKYFEAVIFNERLQSKTQLVNHSLKGKGTLILMYLQRRTEDWKSDISENLERNYCTIDTTNKVVYSFIQFVFQPDTPPAGWPHLPMVEQVLLPLVQSNATRCARESIDACIAALYTESSKQFAVEDWYAWHQENMITVASLPSKDRLREAYFGICWGNCNEVCPYCNAFCTSDHSTDVDHQSRHHLIMAYRGRRDRVTKHPSLISCCQKNRYEYRYNHHGDDEEFFPFDEHVNKFNNTWIFPLLEDVDVMRDDREKAIRNAFLNKLDDFAAHFNYEPVVPDWFRTAFADR